MPLLALSVCAGALLVPALASAAGVTTTVGTGQYLFLAGPGEANTLTVTGDASNYTFTDSVPITDVSAACTPLSATSLRCPRVQGTTPMPRVRVELVALALGPATDFAPNTFRYVGVPPEGTPTVFGLFVGTGPNSETDDDVSGSSGDDSFQLFNGVDKADGGAGDDTITDSGGASGTYSGGDGDDDIRTAGPSTEDTISGGEGDDYLFSSSGVDVLSGEGGNDKLETAPDPGERNGDTLDGGAGDDYLLEEPDTDCDSTVGDLNIGGPGADTVFDSCGQQDVFLLKDGESDRWHCGTLTGKAELDPSDELVEPQQLCARGPDTTIKRGPTVQTAKHKAKFKFTSSNREASFECRVDKAKYKSCDSPAKVKNVDNGKHAFQARAVAGSLVGKPAKYRWKVTPNPR